MKPLVVLLVTFTLVLLATKILNHNWVFVFAGNAAMSIMLLFTAMGHFIYTKGMTMMMPKSLPYKKETVYLTGLIEIAAAIGLMIPSLRYITSILLIIFFFVIIPANTKAAITKVDYQKGTYEGNGLKYLWFRIPLQVFFIAWVWYFGL